MLTTAVINKIQNYFGIAIPTCNKDILQMLKAIGAVFFHCCEATDEVTRHNMCPSDEQSWCKYWRSKVTGSPF